MFELPVRMQRLRASQALRDMFTETRLSVKDVILPLFIKAGLTESQPVAAMPGHSQLALSDLPAALKEAESLGIPAVLLFGIPAEKDATGSSALADQGIVQQAIRIAKEVTPALCVISDLCFCEYTDHGHCGVLHEDQRINNDATLLLLQQQAVSHADAGADVIAPSGMMDGMVKAIRSGLDAHGYSHVPIMSYAVKYASSMYGPFREAAEGAPQFGNRKAYQMNPANTDEALREAALDVQEGADMIMVKPAHTYLDVLYRLKTQYPGIPVVAYHPSGEFAMIKAAAEKGWLNEAQAMLEVLTAMKRAGASCIITYFAKDLAILSNTAT